MDTIPYLLVFSFATGKPWSEETQETEFCSWWKRRFGSDCAWTIRRSEQDEEFCCAYPTRSGANSMVKDYSALAKDRTPEGTRIPREKGRVILALRRVLLPQNMPPKINIPPPDAHKSNFWFAFRVTKDFRITPALHGNDRQSDYRRKPSDLGDLLGDVVMRQLRTVINVAATARWYAVPTKEMQAALTGFE